MEPAKSILAQTLALIPNACCHCCQKCGAVFAVHAKNDVIACKEAEAAPICMECAQ